MNYFAHGYRYTDRPYFLVGTAVPDLLSVVDRRVRMRPQKAAAYLANAQDSHAEITAGIIQHLNDDQEFHNTRAFIEVSGLLTRLFREQLGTDSTMRPSFLGHIVTELLLDGVLIASQPAKLDAYYAAFQSVDPQLVENTANRIVRLTSALTG